MDGLAQAMSNTEETGRMTDLKCNWQDGRQCQFAKYNLPITLHAGKAFCRAHAPEGAHNAMAPDELGKFVDTVLRNGDVDLSGVRFQRRTRGAWAIAPHTEGKPLLLRHCTFDNAGHVRIVGEATLDESRFLGFAELNLQSADASVRGVAFHDRTTIESSSGRQIDLTGSEFMNTVRFHGSQGGIGPLRLDRVTFHRTPVFNDGLSQQTTFHGTRFLRSACTPEDEGTYRDLRKKLGENRAREWEGIAYEREQQCQRRAMFQQRRYFAWFTSLLYGAAARYGHSYERAWAIFFLTQIAFGLLYSWRSGRLGWGRLDTTVVLYTLAPILKPFEGLSTKATYATWAQQVIASNPASLFWPIVTSLQSVISLALVALALLAMRWRFRRE
jgi:hypothetical protein